MNNANWSVEVCFTEKSIKKALRKSQLYKLAESLSRVLWDGFRKRPQQVPWMFYQFKLWAQLTRITWNRSWREHSLPNS